MSMTAYKIEIKKSKLANIICWYESSLKRLTWLLATVYEQYIFLLDKINSNYNIKAKHLSGLFYSKKAIHWL